MVLYSKDSCGPCKTVKYFLDKLGAKYEVKDVTKPENQEELEKTYNVMSVPVLVHDGIVVHGPNIARIRDLLNGV